MTLEQIVARLSTVAAVIGEAWLGAEKSWAEEFIPPRLRWYQQLDADLAILEARVGLPKLISCYRGPLRDKQATQKAIYEIHGAALLAKAAARVDLHVPRGDGSGKDFDVWAEIQGYAINAESKSRKDEFPFNLPPESQEAPGITEYAGVRETIDPHDAVDLGIKTQPPADGLQYIETPESTVIRQGLLAGLEQLPASGCNLLIFGHIEGDRRNLEDALFGTEVFQFIRDHQTKKARPVWVRTPTGAFSEGPVGEPFAALSGVLWVRLLPHGDSLGRAYRFYPNRRALVPLPKDVVSSLEDVMNKSATPIENKEDIVEE